MEALYTFTISYANKFVCYITAHTKYQALDIAYYRLLGMRKEVERKLLKAKRW
jgi:ribosomal protein L20A (L18A)